MTSVHFAVGDTLKGTVSTMDTRELTMKITDIIKKRPLTFAVQTTIDPHRSPLEASMFGSGIERGRQTVTDATLREYVCKGWYTTSNATIQKTYKNKTYKTHKTHKTYDDPDKEYWEYIQNYGSDEEKARAAEYFDVSPSAFDDDYNKE